MKDRLTAMLTLLEHPEPSQALVLLCESSVDELDMTAAAVGAIIGEEPLGLLATAGAGLGAIADHLSTEAGPVWEAYVSGEAIFLPDVRLDVRWPGFADAAAAAGLRALFAFPMRLGSARFGALVLARDRPGPPEVEVVADATVLADVAALLVLAAQARSTSGGADGGIDEAIEVRAVVHQAAGMVSVQLGVDIADAHVALRARAWVLGQKVTEVAGAVVSRRLRFGDD